MSSIWMLPSGCAMFYDILYAQIFLQPHFAQQRQQTLSVALHARSISHSHTRNIIYRVIQEESALLWEMIV